MEYDPKCAIVMLTQFW